MYRIVKYGSVTGYKITDNVLIHKIDKDENRDWFVCIEKLKEYRIKLASSALKESEIISYVYATLQGLEDKYRIKQEDTKLVALHSIRAEIKATKFKLGNLVIKSFGKKGELLNLDED